MSAAALPLDVEAFRANGFPVYSLNPQQQRDELQKLIMYDRSRLIVAAVVKQAMHGLSLTWHYQPHASGVRCNGKLTSLEVFFDPERCEKALKRRSGYGTCTTKSDHRKALRMFSGTQAVAGFRPTVAAALYDRYLPKTGGVVWDMCAGYGGRLLGAMVCNRVNKYIGTDPATLTMDGLREMHTDVARMLRGSGLHIPEVQLHCIGSEDFVPEPGSLDLCLTSPPYWDCEKYSDEPTQSYMRFKTREEWLTGFLGQTLENCRVGLKPDGYLVINIANVETYPKLEEDFLGLATANGWRLVETLQMRLSKAPGTGKQLVAFKTEPIFVFRRMG